MTASEDHGSQARHGTLRKQLHLRSLVLFGLAYMTPIIVLGIFGVIAKLSDGGSAEAYLLATVAMLFTTLSYGLDGQALPGRRFGLPYVRRALDSRLGFVVG
jgi:putrescine importer